MTVHPSIWTEMGPEPGVARALGGFGLHASSLQSVGPLVSGAGTHQGYRVRAEDRDWVLKRHTSSAALERLRASHLLERRLAEVGFPVATIRRSSSGATLVSDGRAHYSLHEWVEGRQVSIASRAGLIDERPDLVDHLGTTIGRLHAVSGGLGGRPGPVDPDSLLRAPLASVDILRARRRLFLSSWDALRLKRRKSPFEQWAVDVLPEVSGLAERLSVRSLALRVDRSEVGLIHNDVNWENLVFDDQFDLVALLDFDNAVLAPWVLEVGACAVVLVGADAGHVERFVTSYEAASDSRVDRDLVRLGMELKCVRSILASVLAHLNGDPDNDLRIQWCHHLYDSLRGLREG